MSMRWLRTGLVATAALAGVLGLAACAPSAPAAAPPGQRVLFVHLRQNPQDDGRLEQMRQAIEARRARIGPVQVQPLWLEGGYNPEAARPLIAAALARGPWDVVFTGNMGFASLVRELEAAVPIVYAGAADPLAMCLADSLARPGRNASGYTAALPAEAKMAEALLDLYPAVRQLTVLLDGREPPGEDCAAGAPAPTPDCVPGRADAGFAGGRVDTAGLAQLARARDVALQYAVLCHARDLARLPAPGRHDAARAGFLVPFQLLFFESADELVATINATGSPAVYSRFSFARRGGLLSVSPTLERADRSRATEVLLRVLEGQPAGEVPVQLPHGFELMLNVSTASALGLGPDPAALALVRHFHP
jgi:putative ABC transport system substrate-binding protein